jgi:hypothetical protein
MPLSYVRDDCHKQAVTPIWESRRFESMYTLLGGKPDQHDTYASHASPRMPGVRFLRAVPVRDNLSRDADRFGHIPLLSRKKRLLTQSTARRLTDPRVRTQLLSWSNQWSRGRKLSSWRWPTTRFIGPISPACDRYVQYLLMGDNRTVLNWPRRRLQPWGCWLATCPLPDLLNQLFPLSPKGHARSPF